MNTRRQRLANPLRNPVAASILKTRILKDLRELQTDAQLHALIGANDPKLIDNAGRLACITTDAARACKLPEDGADMRIVAGMAHALADLANNHGDRSLHRLSIQSGLLACERLLAQCSPWAIGTAAIKVDELINSPAGLTLHDITQPKATA